MADFRSRIQKLSPERLALLALELQSRLEKLERQRTEPIAIIGMGCRIPGADSGADSGPDAFWQLLEEGRDAISEIPPERWDAAAYYDPDGDVPGRMATKWGGFLSDIAAFDAPFFGISRREAVSMDPQQRMLLEVCWEALEHAGHCPRKAAGGDTGVFVGMTTLDYHDLMLERGEDTIDIHMATGSGHSTATGRISYTLNLQGPSVALDTACSGSLVAVHLACQSLRNNECRMALAGGVNALLSPEHFISLSKAGALAPDGHCKAFDASANGFARAEGCGIVVLKRLSHALADGDNVLALIRGTALNQDGRSSGLTAPNGAAQEAVVRQALANAGVAPEEVDYVEAHGTGTPLGDPIEAHALAAVLSPNRTKDHPLVLASVKTNVGHLESASGVTGLIKVVLALQHNLIPSHLHFHSINPHISWQGMPYKIPVKAIPWVSSQKRRIAGLNSFGLSGTNAHAVIEEAPAREERVAAFERPLHLLTLSARSASALKTLTEKFAGELSRTKTTLGDICYTAGLGRAHLEHRAAFVAATPDAMREALLKAPSASGSATAAPQVVFFFPGQGSQYSGMVRELYDTQPVFREILDKCAELLASHLEKPLLEVLWSETLQLLDQTAYTQPALFAVEYALTKLWMSWGIQPAAVLGHSVGEYVAACIAGMFSLEDGLKLIAARARLMQGVSGHGAMAAVMAGEDRVRKAVAGLENRVTIAALNAPANVVIAGYQSDLESVRQALEKDGIRVQSLAVSHAFHSPQMREMEAAFEEVARSITFHSPALRIISSVTGREANGEMLDPAYWRRQVVQPVRFQAAMETLDQAGYSVFLEAGPGTTLAGLGKQCIPKPETTWLPSIRKARGEWTQMLGSLAQLYALGAEISWTGFDKPYSRRRVPLPTYPFERQHYWFETRGASKRLPRLSTPGENLDDWFYEVAWEQKDPHSVGAKTRGQWLIVPDRLGVAAEFGKKLSKELGVDAVFANDAPSLAKHLKGGKFDFVVHAASLDYTDSADLDPASVQGALAVALPVAQIVAAEQNSARLWLVTSGAAPVRSEDAGPNLLQAPIWGMGRTFALEHPESWGGLADLEAATVPAMAESLFSAIVENDGEDEVAFRGSRRYVARLVRKRAEVSPQQFSADKTYLITGGLGGLGLKMASWMADHGARHLLLLGRRAPSKDTAKALDALRQREVQVEFQTADVASRPALQAALAKLGADLPPLAGIIHAAGVLDDGVIAQLRPERFEKVLSPKVTGTWNLHKLTQDLPLDFFVMFSSLASVTGAPGQASYAAANAFMDAFAHFRQRLGLPATSVNWGGWADAGMAARTDSELRHRAGAFRLMPSDSALAAFGRLLSGAPTQVTVASVDWEQFGNTVEGRNAKPLFRALLRPAPHRQEEKPSASKADFTALRSLPAEALRPRLVAYLRDALAPILGIEAAEVDSERPIIDYGVDSLMSLEFRNQIRADLDVVLSTAALLQGPTLTNLATEIVPLLAPPKTADGDKPVAAITEYPLSFCQQSQWFGHKIAPGSSTFNIAFTASVSPNLNFHALERAIARLVQRHPALRTIVIENREGQAVQRVLDSITPDLLLVDAAGWPEETLKDRVMEEFQRGFPIDQPMVRIRVFRTTGRDVLLFAVDHLIVDASSVQICFEDLKKLYPAELAGTAATLDPLKTDYADFVKWEAELAEGAESDRLWNYWKRRLHGDLPILRLPSSRPRPAVLLPKGDSVPLSLGAELSSEVNRVARENRTTSYTVVLAAYYLLLKRYCNQDDFVVGTSVSRRDDPARVNVVGFFVNVVPLRADLSGDLTFVQHLTQTRESVLGALTHHEFPFPLMVNRLRLPRTTAHNPVFQAFLNFLTDRSGELGGLMTRDRESAIMFGQSTLRPFMILPQQEGQSEIVLQLAQVESQIVGNLNYNTEILDRPTVEAMAQSYVEILEQAVRAPNDLISAFMPESGPNDADREEIFL
jgi:malonyl CoA-acyl carrier protein transacylase